MLMLKDNKKLVGKALPHPFEAVKIQQYFDGIYYGIILADTVVLVWVVVRETRRDHRRKEALSR